jgi:hypothetical protein
MTTLPRTAAGPIRERTTQVECQIAALQDKVRFLEQSRDVFDGRLCDSRDAAEAQLRILCERVQLQDRIIRDLRAQVDALAARVGR